jgi:hypothetical protein
MRAILGKQFGGPDMVHYRSADTGDHRVFYREAGEPGHPAILLSTASPPRPTCSAT